MRIAPPCSCSSRGKTDHAPTGPGTGFCFQVTPLSQLLASQSAAGCGPTLSFGRLVNSLNLNETVLGSPSRCARRPADSRRPERSCPTRRAPSRHGTSAAWCRSASGAATCGRRPCLSTGFLTSKIIGRTPKPQQEPRGSLDTTSSVKHCAGGKLPSGLCPQTKGEPARNTRTIPTSSCPSLTMAAKFCCWQQRPLPQMTVR